MVVGQRLFLYTISTLVIIHCKEYMMASLVLLWIGFLDSRTVHGRGSGCARVIIRNQELINGSMLYLLAR